MKQNDYRDDAIYISDKLDNDENANVGIILPFGNYEGETITRSQAIQIIKHLKKIFFLKWEEEEVDVSNDNNGSSGKVEPAKGKR